MSTIDTIDNTDNQMTTNYDVSKIFIWGNRFVGAQYNNDGYAPVTIAEGTVMGRIKTTGKVIPLESDATDGSQYPVGILQRTITVDEGDTVIVDICIAGDVAQEKVILVKDGDTLETVIDNRQIRDRITGDTMGIKLVPGTEQTGFDNQ